MAKDPGLPPLERAAVDVPPDERETVVVFKFATSVHDAPFHNSTSAVAPPEYPPIIIAAVVDPPACPLSLPLTVFKSAISVQIDPS